MTFIKSNMCYRSTKYTVLLTKSCYSCIVILMYKGVFKGGVQGVQTPPEIFRFFLKSEGKEIERKRKKGMLGGGEGLPLNIFLGLIFF